MLWTIIGLIVLVYVLLRIPAVQRYFASEVAESLSATLGTKVEVGRVNIGLPSRITIDDVLVYDQSSHPMLSASRLSATVDVMPLFDGRISISSAQIFGFRAQLYKQDALTPANYQFVIDSLSSKSPNKKRPLDVNIRSLIVRNGQLSYHRRDIAPSQHLTPHHIDITNLSGHFMLHQLTDDALDMELKKLSFTESQGLQVKNMSFDLRTDKKHATIEKMSLELPESELRLSDIAITYPQPSSQRESSWRIEGTVAPSKVSPGDLSAFNTTLGEIGTAIDLSAQIAATPKSIQLSQLKLKAHDQSVVADGDITLSHQGNNIEGTATLHPLFISRERISNISKMVAPHYSIPPSLSLVGDIRYQGVVTYSPTSLYANGDLITDVGSVNFDIKKSGPSIEGYVKTAGIEIDKLTGMTDFGHLAADLSFKSSLPINKDMSMTAKGSINEIGYKGHVYRNINIDGHYTHHTFDGLFTMDDPNGQIDFSGSIDMSRALPQASLSMQVRHFDPHELGLTPQLAGHVFDFDADVDLQGNHLHSATGNIGLQHFHMTSPRGNIDMEELSILAANESGQESRISVKSDYIDGEVLGRYNRETMVSSITHILSEHLPSLISPKSTSLGNNHFTFTADVRDTEWLHPLIKMPITLSRPLHIEGAVDESQSFLDLSLDADELSYDDQLFINTHASLTTEDNALIGTVSTQKSQSSQQPLDLILHAEASHDQLTTEVEFDNHGTTRQIRGSVLASTDFSHEEHLQPLIRVSIHPSHIFIGNTAWNVNPSTIVYSSKSLAIDNFAIENADQHIRIHGVMDRTANDTITVELNKINMSYLSTLMNVKNVDFGGRLSGKGHLTSLYSQPKAEAQVQVSEFKFVDGRMGDLTAGVNWDKESNKIYLNGIITEEAFSNTFVSGDISLAPSELNLHFDTHKTPLEFLERYCGTFLSDVEARVTGPVHVFGSFKKPNIEADVTAHGDVKVKSLNTTYTMKNNHVLLMPDHIYFDNDTLVDRDGHLAVMSGSVDHTNLTRFQYDLDISAHNALVYDHPDFGNNTFCGTVYATGTCGIKGKAGETVIDVDANTEKGTLIQYNVSTPDAISKQEFIQWNDITDTELPSDGFLIPQDIVPVEQSASGLTSMPANMHINFMVNWTPDATLRLIMNQDTGDYIDLSGEGALRATYFNKGGFQLFGNYIVDHGIYKMTIQNIIKKDFLFQSGGTIAFGGSPFNAALDLKAVYTVNGVPLSDLNIGRNFSSNNIRVNCIMNIRGTANSPQVDFDMELPTVNSDAQQMVRSLINSEEELNQQVIYLLTIGRFYSPNNSSVQESQQSQTSLAMQSLLSGTISQQINNVLSSVVNNNNWNFGANISTGDEGWNNAEYEGILSGRLLNNRLLINGQFGYRDNANATTSFIGDFDVRYLLFANGNLAVRVYNQTNDRYFTKNSLNTQGLGIIMKKDFNGWRDLFGIKSKKTSVQRSTPSDTLYVVPEDSMRQHSTY